MKRVGPTDPEMGLAVKEEEEVEVEMEVEEWAADGGHDGDGGDEGSWGVADAAWLQPPEEEETEAWNEDDDYKEGRWKRQKTEYDYKYQYGQEYDKKYQYDQKDQYDRKYQYDQKYNYGQKQKWNHDKQVKGEYVKGGWQDQHGTFHRYLTTIINLCCLVMQTLNLP